jgi:hypothetical protein
LPDSSSPSLYHRPDRTVLDFDDYIAAIWHRISGIKQDVDDCQLSLGRINAGVADRLLRNNPNLHEPPGGTLDQRLQLVDQVDEVDDAALQLLPTGEGKELLGQRRATLRGLQHGIDRACRPLAIELSIAFDLAL